MPFEVKRFEQTMKFIPKTSFHSGIADHDNPEYILQNVSKSELVTVDSFYICDHEVMNGEYLEFLFDIRMQDTALYSKMLPDTLAWRDKLSYNEPYVEYYFRHPAYRSYPVVGVSHEQAEQYCKWLTEKYAEEEKRKYKNAVFQLPNSVQWECAAKSGFDLAIFPWGGPYLQNKKGQWLANFLVIPQREIAYATMKVENLKGETESKKIRVAGAGYHSSPNADVTAPSYSYYPTDFGLYNMAGNVEELVKEKGVTKGGSWKDTGYYLQNFVFETYDSTCATSAERGFRVAMMIDAAK